MQRVSRNWNNHSLDYSEDYTLYYLLLILKKKFYDKAGTGFESAQKARHSTY